MTPRSGARASALWLVPALLVAAVTPEASESAARKFQRIAAGGLASGESLVLLEDELNAYVRFHEAAQVPEGVEEPELRLRAGGAIVQAMLDLEKFGESASGELPWVMRLLLRGKRTVTLDIDYAVSDGFQATKLVSIEIEGVELEGTVLDWFLETFAPAPLQPYMHGEKVRLQGGVREVRVEPGRAVIVAE